MFTYRTVSHYQSSRCLKDLNIKKKRLLGKEQAQDTFHKTWFVEAQDEGRAILNDPRTI